MLITDDPALIDIAGPSVVFRPDEGAARYLLPTLPTGYLLLTDVEALCERVEVLLAETRARP
jgi:hypothetical protein